MLCPRCGREREHFANRTCVECFVEREGLLDLPDDLELTVCVSCGAVKLEGWKDLELEDAASLLVEKETDHPEGLRSPRVEFHAEEVLPGAIRGTARLEGELGGRTVREERRLEVKAGRGVCGRCSKASQGYFEAVLQVRASGRDPSDEEMESIMMEASEMARVPSKEKPFVTKVEEESGGLDIYMGDNRQARELTGRLKEDFGGETTRSASLVGEEDGQRVYRTTYLLRLPHFRRGDLLRFRGEDLLVTSLGEVVELVELKSGEKKFVPSKKLSSSSKVGDIGSAEEALLSMVEGDEVQVIDPETMRAATLRRPGFVSEGDQGGTVTVIRLDGELKIVNPKAL